MLRCEGTAVAAAVAAHGEAAGKLHPCRAGLRRWSDGAGAGE